jgi:hypothetical protein
MWGTLDAWCVGVHRGIESCRVYINGLHDETTLRRRLIVKPQWPFVYKNVQNILQIWELGIYMSNRTLRYARLLWRATPRWGNLFTNALRLETRVNLDWNMKRWGIVLYAIIFSAYICPHVIVEGGAGDTKQRAMDEQRENELATYSFRHFSVAVSAHHLLDVSIDYRQALDTMKWVVYRRRPGLSRLADCYVVSVIASFNTEQLYRCHTQSKIYTCSVLYVCVDTSTTWR